MYKSVKYFSTDKSALLTEGMQRLVNVMGLEPTLALMRAKGGKEESK